MQVKEMEEMKCSRKPTEREKRQWKGPVHYAAHHADLRLEKKSTPMRIELNRSASVKGHMLNDYWFKGPDLLNNLFGVMFRYQESAVHRFSWPRSYETERESDIYVKTVLTFRDRLAPTIVITAMRETANR